MSIKNAIIAIIGNKSDSESFFEQEIIKMEAAVKALH